MLRCYDVTLTMLRSYDVTLLQCYDIKMLRYYAVTMLRSYDVTTAYGLPLCTDRNEAVKSWNNGRVWCSSIYRTKRGRLIMESGAPNEKKFSKILEILLLFQSFLKASLCKLIQINLFGVFS